MTGSPTVASPVRPRTSNISRSLVSCITAPFASKPRSPVELEIRLDEPFRQYFSGDTVTGAVRLLATRPSRITHIVIRLHGFVKVVNNVRLPGETIPYDENLLTSMRRRKGIEYFGNGFARLFEDEQILCGEGRVDSEYEFRFEFILPSKGIPSSIDVRLKPPQGTLDVWLTHEFKFEHGTISYLLTATLTRPTTISPTLTIHHKLNVTGTIDIAHLQPPKPRVVSRKAPSRQKKGKIRTKKRTSEVPNGRISKASSLDGNSANGLPSPGAQVTDVPPQSPAPSTISSGSTGGSTASIRDELQNASVAETLGGLEQTLQANSPEEATTLKTELLQGGCLPGDTLQLRISVDHRKSVKTMQGIVITVFRQGRIDTHPELPLSQSERGGKSRFEDYIPKSRTGLGGLSLTSAGSSRVFRQDLAQTIMPLIIDPQTLVANIKTSIQMPDHVFPTITCVPGSMITFKYHIEIVVDLRGKPAGQDRFLPHLSITSLPQHSYGDPKVSKIESGDGISYSATPGFNCLITDQLRRTKNDVLFTTTEVVVGTKDSARSRGKRRKDHIELNGRDSAQRVPPDGDSQADDVVSPLPQHEQMPSQENRPTQEYPSENRRPDHQAPVFPLPDVDEPQDEKTQIRRAEERLLPSSPPQDDEPSTASIPPTAPFAHNEEDFVHRYGFHPPAPSYDGTFTYNSNAENRSAAQSQSPPDSSAQPTAQGVVFRNSTQQLESQHTQVQGSAPQNIEDNDAYGPSNYLQNPNSNATPHEENSANVTHSSLPDRLMQEHQQHNSEVQATSPDETAADEVEAPSSSVATQPQHPAASAPTLDEVHPTRTHDDHDYEDLPVYRR